MTEKYRLGEAVLASQGVLIYEAKIQDIKKEKGVVLYGIHYKGWNKSWDEYVTDARLLKITEENLKDFNIHGLTFKPGGSITVSGDAKMTLKVDGKEIEIKNE